MNNKFWILYLKWYEEHHIDGEYSESFNVFSTKEKAIEYANKFRQENESLYYFSDGYLMPAYLDNPDDYNYEESQFV